MYSHLDRSALSDAALYRAAPSVFATSPSSKTSEKYSFIPTTRVRDALSSEGWRVFSAAQSSVRKDDRQGYQKHILRFRREGLDVSLRRVGRLIPELVLTNSHDGTSSFRLMLGVFRIICENGLLVQSGTVSEKSIRHMGYTDNDVIEASYEIIRELPAVEESIGTMQETRLAPAEQEAFASAALSLRWDDEARPVAPARLLRSRMSRREDRENDVFTVMNVVQENIIRGGVMGRDQNNRPKRTRAVGSVTEDIRINRALWRLAEEMKTIKNGEIRQPTSLPA